MRRGEVWWVNFDPAMGGEIKKTRPAIIISNNISNEYLNRVQVVPLTSNTSKIYPSECLVMVKDKASKVAGNQITTVSKKRLNGRLSSITDDEMLLIEDCIKLQLGIG